MIKITTDSTCDLPAQLLEQHHISVIPLGIVKGGELFRDGENITTADIAAHVDAGGDITTTNAVSIGDYEALFARESARNDAVIHLNIGIGFSCCHQNACLAAEEFDNVHVVDTANLSVGHGLLVLLAAEAAEAGASVEEILAHAGREDSPGGNELRAGPAGLHEKRRTLLRRCWRWAPTSSSCTPALRSKTERWA